jgi:NAD(P)H-hydrate repair Nnr-like enzyme with NAD(P)H-hydrate dehydratase domain
MTVAGTGDTLLGIIASLLGRGMDRREAAELGAWILSETDELVTAEYGPGVVATDVIERIPNTIRWPFRSRFRRPIERYGSRRR